LQTGFRAALATGHGLIGFCDADGQFEIASFGTLLAALQDREADLAVGYRIARADSLKRRVMGRSWHWLSSLVLGARTARDVDCGFKIFTRAVLADVGPRISGGYAAVSPEILTRAISAGYTMAEAGVTHKSRSHGQQTGSDLKVVLLSLASLFQLRLTLRTEN
jgi:dolichol-phosphate mannosyltransferase